MDKLVIFAILGIIIVGWFTGWTDPKTTNRILSEQGYTDIQIEGRAWFACGSSYYSTKFNAISPTGQVINGAVCSGLFTNYASIKFN